MSSEPAMPGGSGPRILYYDIETTPSLVWTWSQWQTNVIATERDWHLLSFSYKWEHERKTHFAGLIDDPDFYPDTDNDRMLAEKMADLFGQADLIVAHNGDRFDLKKVNSRILYHEIEIPAHPKTIDTLKEARRYFNLYSYKLDEVARYLGIGRKVQHPGFVLWRECMRGDPKAWRTMRRYNTQDVRLLQRVYKRMLPWIGSPGHSLPINAGHWVPDGSLVCPKPGCGGKKLMKRGRYRTASAEYQRWHCQRCGGYSRARFKDKAYEMVDPRVK